MLSWKKLPFKKANETEPKADGNTIKTNLFSNSSQLLWIFSSLFYFQIPHLFYGLLLLTLPIVKDQYIHTFFKVFSDLWMKGATTSNSFCVYKKNLL